MLRDVVVCDLDSTIADTRHRWEFVPTPENGLTWTDYATRCGADSVIEPIAALVRLLAQNHDIYFLSGRPVVVIEETAEWLIRNRLPTDGIFLAPHEHPSQDAVRNFKTGTLARILEHRNVVLAIEDWPSIAADYEALGVPTILVGQSMNGHEYASDIVERSAALRGVQTTAPQNNHR